MNNTYCIRSGDYSSYDMTAREAYKIAYRVIRRLRTTFNERKMSYYHIILTIEKKRVCWITCKGNVEYSIDSQYEFHLDYNEGLSFKRSYSCEDYLTLYGDID